MQKIMFNDKFGLTKAVLEGRKTQTRRLLPKKSSEGSIIYDDDFQNRFKVKITDQFIDYDDQLCVRLEYLSPSARHQGIDAYTMNQETLPNRFKLNEIVAIAQDYETVNKEYIDKVFRCHGKTGRDILDNGMEACKTCKNPDYCLDKYASVCASPGWQNKMFVKADLMLHQIRITGIHLERLQDISDEDCLKEGIRKWEDEKEYLTDKTIRKSVDELKAAGYDAYTPGCWDCYTSPREAYAALIDKISGKGTWEKNPWVFVYDFELVK